MFAPVTTRTSFFAAKIVPIPIVTACVGTSASEAKKRWFASDLARLEYVADVLAKGEEEGR